VRLLPGRSQPGTLVGSTLILRTDRPRDDDPHVVHFDPDDSRRYFSLIGGQGILTCARRGHEAEVIALLHGLGESKTPEPFKKACSMFIHTDNFREPSLENPAPAQSTRKTKKELRGDTELMNALRAAVEAVKDDTGWAFMGRIGHYIANDAKLSCKNYGYARWSDLIRATEYFEESVKDEHHVYFRRRQAANSAAGG
jgi:hypothetical protein